MVFEAIAVRAGKGRENIWKYIYHYNIVVESAFMRLRSCIHRGIRAQDVLLSSVIRQSVFQSRRIAERTSYIYIARAF